MADGAMDADFPSDVDAEGEDDMEIDPALLQQDQQDGVDAEGEPDDDLSEDPDAEGEDDEDAEGEEDEDVTKAEYHGAVKIRNEDLASDAEDDDSDGQESGDAQSGSDESDESESESDAENEWDVGSVDAEEGEVDIAARNNCIFCGQDEENDPGEEFEEYLACAVCGDNSHRQCARDKNSYTDDIEPSKWRCPSCTQNELEADGDDDAEADEADPNEDGTTTRAESIQRRLSTSSHRLTKDLLPQTRGRVEPGSHSIFNTLIPEEDPADGSRSLRKRKASSDALEPASRASSKRPKKSEEESESTSPVVAGRARSSTAVSRARRTPAAGEPATPAATDVLTTQASTRPQRRRPKKDGPVQIVSKTATSLIVSFKVDMSKIRTRPKRKRTEKDRERDRMRNRKKRRDPPPEAEVAPVGPHVTANVTTPYTTPFFAFHEREEDEKLKKPYGGILAEADAANDKTFPDASDRAKFEKAKRMAEEEWKERAAASEAEQEPKSRAAQKVAGPPSKIKCISFGGWEIDTWYAAPYPEEYSRNRVLYICEFCLKYMGSDYVAWRHKLKCPMKHPPGDEIYREDSVSVFEVDGRKNPAYCQNLCLLAKLFLGSKTLYYDVEPFLFYIMTEYDELGCHFVGYFSKEKRPSSLNNVSCILTLPIHQRKGYGNLLIDFSYLLTKVEKKTGSPEKPLSDMGLVSYRNYWRLVLCYLLRDNPGPLSIADISELTGMTADDIVAALEALRALVRDPVTKTYALRLDKAYFSETIEKWEAKGYVKLNPDALMWTPYVMGRSNLANYDRPALATIAPREGEEEDVVPEEGVQLEQQAETAIGGKPTLENGNGDTNGAVPDIGADPMLEAPLPPTTLPEPLLNPNAAIVTSPAKSPALVLTNGEGASKGPEPTQNTTTPIPPSRYELYPPVAGTIYRAAKRGGYRPKGSRITAMGPVFGNSPAMLPPQRDRNRNRNRSGKAVTTGKAQGGKGSKGSPSLRKTRSSGVGVVVPDMDGGKGKGNGMGKDGVVDEDEVDGDGDGDQDEDADADADADGDEETNETSIQDAEGEDEEYVEGEEEDAEGEDEEVEEEEED